ncbi:MAG: MarR family transcriptional regulator [Clostridia bacterium]|nr:MarR family transcriptional regulator [Clostridia bacterium]
MESLNRSIEVGRLFREVISLMHQKMDRVFESMGITAPQGMILSILIKKGKMKISELSEQIFLSNSTVSGIIDRLENQGIVERERSMDDKRVVYVKLSPKADEMHKDFHQIVEAKWEKLIKKGTQEDLEKILEGLNTLKRLLSEPKK